MTEQKTCYVAGPMRGYDLWNFPAFDRWRDFLIADGWKVWSPADMDRDLGLDENDYPELPAWFTMGDTLKRDFTAIIDSNAIVLLPKWEGSSGASVHELPVAHSLSCDVYLAIEDEDGKPLSIVLVEPDQVLEWVLAYGVNRTATH